jgi:hypothetical protein
MSRGILSKAEKEKLAESRKQVAKVLERDANLSDRDLYDRLLKQARMPEQDMYEEKLADNPLIHQRPAFSEVPGGYTPMPAALQQAAQGEYYHSFQGLQIPLSVLAVVGVHRAFPNLRRAWIVGGGRSLAASGARQRIDASLAAAGIDARLVATSDGEPTVAHVASGLAGLAHEDRDGVVVVAKLNFWAARASLSVQVLDMRPSLTTVLRRFEAVKIKLEAEGLLALEKKRSLPAFPSCIALLTSVPSSALADLLRTAQQRWPACAIRVVPIPVQGDKEKEICSVFEKLEKHWQQLGIEALVLARGGGSREDLAIFDCEADEQPVHSVGSLHCCSSAVQA